MPLHDTIRSCGACRFPCTSANRKVWPVSRMFRADENRMTLNYSTFYFTADSVAPVVRLSNQSGVTILNDLHLIRTQDEAGGMYECTGMRPSSSKHLRIL